jgi:hypothetical protein
MLVGLEEVEGKDAVYSDLAQELNDTNPDHTWSAAFVPSGDERNITQGYLWRDEVALVGPLHPVSGAPYSNWVSDGIIDFVRTPPAGLFRFFAGTATQFDLNVYAFHFKSKRSDSACVSPDCSDVREREAADLRDLLAHHHNVGEAALAGGDLNDGLGTTPISILENSQALLGLYQALEATDRYSYIFNGESQALDHIYVSRNLAPSNGTPHDWVFQFQPQHINADFPDRENFSDHDPIRVRFRFAPVDSNGFPGADLGDLPSDYDLAWHYAPFQAFLGERVEVNIGFSPGNDRDDDGVELIGAGNFEPGGTIGLHITVSGIGGWLTGWLDWNQNGVLENAELSVNQATPAGESNLFIRIPASAVLEVPGGASSLKARFRLYPAGNIPDEGVNPIGGVNGGEVEDYVWGYNPTAIRLLDFHAKNQGDNFPELLKPGFVGLFLCCLTGLCSRFFHFRRRRSD